MGLLKCTFFFISALYSILNDSCEQAYENAFFFSFFDKPSNCKRLVTNNKQYNNEEIKTIQFFVFVFYFIFFFRAIRTRTVDLLGKTDQTDYSQNDSNCFKDPTCIFLHWALPLTDINNQLVYHNSLDKKIRRWLHVL